MGRHRIHTDNAARQRAYRERLKAAGLGSFNSGLAATPARQGAGVTSAQRAMHERVARTVRQIDPSIDTSAVDGAR